MIRALVSVLVLGFASVSFADAACDKLVLSCRAVYQSFDGAATAEVSEANFADENVYEPSLSNCAATTYFKNGDTTVRVYASKDANNVVAYSAMAIEKVGRSATYSNEAKATASVGMIANMGALQLSVGIPTQDSLVKDIYVGCSTK